MIKLMLTEKIHDYEYYKKLNSSEFKTLSDEEYDEYDAYEDEANDLEQAKKDAQVQRYVFNIQVLDRDNQGDSISMLDVPQNVLNSLAKEIVKHPDDRMFIYNNFDEEEDPLYFNDED